MKHHWKNSFHVEMQASFKLYSSFHSFTHRLLRGLLDTNSTKITKEQRHTVHCQGPRRVLSGKIKYRLRSCVSGFWVDSSGPACTVKLSLVSRGLFFFFSVLWLFQLQGRPASNVFFSQFYLHLSLGQQYGAFLWKDCLKKKYQLEPPFLVRIFWLF